MGKTEREIRKGNEGEGVRTEMPLSAKRRAPRLPPHPRGSQSAAGSEACQPITARLTQDASVRLVRKLLCNFCWLIFFFFFSLSLENYEACDEETLRHGMKSKKHPGCGSS